MTGYFDTNFPCRAACPVNTNAGGYVSLVAQGRYREAYLLARAPNPLASVCGRVCAHPCEAACRRGQIDAPIAIRAMKRFVTERFGVESDVGFDEIARVVERPRPPATRAGRVAIIGGSLIVSVMNVLLLDGVAKLSEDLRAAAYRGIYELALVIEARCRSMTRLDGAAD